MRAISDTPVAVSPDWPVFSCWHGATVILFSLSSARLCLVWNTVFSHSFTNLLLSWVIKLSQIWNQTDFNQVIWQKVIIELMNCMKMRNFVLFNFGSVAFHCESLSFIQMFEPSTVGSGKLCWWFYQLNCSPTVIRFGRHWQLDITMCQIVHEHPGVSLFITQVLPSENMQVWLTSGFTWTKCEVLW